MIHQIEDYGAYPVEDYQIRRSSPDLKLYLVIWDSLEPVDIDLPEDYDGHQGDQQDRTDEAIEPGSLHTQTIVFINIHCNIFDDDALESARVSQHQP